MDAQCNWNTMESFTRAHNFFRNRFSLISYFLPLKQSAFPLLNSSHSSFLIISGSLHEDFSSVWPEFHTIICSSCWGRSTKPAWVESGTTLSPISPTLVIFVRSFCTWFVYLTDPYDHLKSCWFSSGYFGGDGGSGILVFVLLLFCCCLALFYFFPKTRFFCASLAVLKLAL